MTDVKPGRYLHYKNRMYQVIGTARHSETGEHLVVYEALYDQHELWVRPVEEFSGEVKVNRELVPRFKYIKD